MERIKEILSSHDIRPSHHRIKVLQYLAEHHTHPTVEMIYHDMVDIMPTISKATIYNTLNILQEKGLVSATNVSGDETRYEYKKSKHAHFYCMECGKVLDIESDYPCLEIDRIGSNKVWEVQLFFKGACKECLRKKRKKEGNGKD